MDEFKSSGHEQALTFAKAIARLARVNSAIHRRMQNGPAHEAISTLEAEMYDTDSMLATAEDDLRLGSLLFTAIDSASSNDEQVQQTSDCPTASRVAGQATRGIAKKPRHIKGQVDGGMELAISTDPKLMKAAHALRCSLQNKFPLTWQKLLEDS
ncbi:hypothetical protein CKM354_001119400 [Cercospora kikuchii]|uniref:Uncharacterized protein n=1 Tax=Cercospora kikuchii TaxID=84275 RepID=A0A9P3FI35_9PEZI|nr:uncharacterized protein CKM354_001119400 [Cercospora kikuchii]GIZ48121.1 hypothetical protein CKM354_001119400 [Cercospora kikuchii]